MLYTRIRQRKELVTALESYHGLDEGQVFVGVGSDDVLALAFLTFFNSDKPILFPDVTYSFYPVWANVYRIPYECPKLTDDFRICPDDYKRKMVALSLQIRMHQRLLR